MNNTYYCPRGCTEVQIFTSHGQEVIASANVCPFCEADLTDDRAAYDDAVKEIEARDSAWAAASKADLDDFVERRKDRELAMVKGMFIGAFVVFVLLWALS